jgi:putative phage-type endonuclease
MTIKMLKMAQGSHEWLELRRSHRTASETPIVMGKSRYKAPLALAREKRGLAEPEKENIAMKHGKKHEPIVRAAVSEKLGIDFEPAVLAVTIAGRDFVDGPYLASLDGLNAAGDTILEIKCPFSEKSKDLEEARQGKVPEAHWWQIQHQLMVSQAALCHYAVRDLDDSKLIMLQVKPEQTAFTRIREEWDIFWEAMMKCPAEELMEFQPIPADLRSLVDDLLKAKDMQKRGKALYETAKKKLCEELPNDSEGYGIRLRHIEKKGSTDWAAFQKAHPDLDYEKFRKPSSTVPTITDN